MSQERIHQFHFGIKHFLDGLGVDMYKTAAAALMEIIRNGLVACMPSGKWVAKQGNVEVHLNAHPLSPNNTSLIVLDHGSGITDMVRYTKTGRDFHEALEHSGAAQKGMGRFAGFALNRKTRDKKNRDLKTGFHVLTRTTKDGPVSLIAWIPEKMLQHKGISETTISANDPLMGMLKGIKGSFTAVIIANSVYDNYDQIREDLKWYLPRGKDKMYRLLVGGKQVVAPDLAGRINLGFDCQDIDAYVSRDSENNDDPQKGIWLTDADTGIRVALARNLGPQWIASPLYRSNMVGDIFIRGLLANQDSSRQGLSDSYLNSDEWETVKSILALHVAPKVKEQYGDDDRFGHDSTSKAVMSFVDGAIKAWGSPTGVSSGGGVAFGSDGKAKPARVLTMPKPVVPNPSTGRGMHLNNRKPKPDGPSFRMNDEDYVLNRRSMDPRNLVEVDDTHPGVLNVIWISSGGYIGMPPTAEARAEHVKMQIIVAVAGSYFPDDFGQAQKMVGRLSAEFEAQVKPSASSKRK